VLSSSSTANATIFYFRYDDCSGSVHGEAEGRFPARLLYARYGGGAFRPEVEDVDLVRAFFRDEKLRPIGSKANSRGLRQRTAY
jgi:hypothetical protein